MGAFSGGTTHRAASRRRSLCSNGVVRVVRVVRGRPPVDLLRGRNRAGAAGCVRARRGDCRWSSRTRWRLAGTRRGSSCSSISIVLKISTAEARRCGRSSKSIPTLCVSPTTLDAERKARGSRGPLHGIPILIKDNIDTADRMMTTAGSLALEGAIAATDAFVVERLRAAGAVILGKTNLSEWANIRSTRSIERMERARWAGRRIPTRSTAIRADRVPASGVAVSANLARGRHRHRNRRLDRLPVVASTASSASSRPSGWSAASGIVPISHTQDTAGPMARTVSDAAILLTAMAGVDPRDTATARPRRSGPRTTRQGWTPERLKGARIGVVAEASFRLQPGSRSRDRVRHRDDRRQQGAVHCRSGGDSDGGSTRSM